MPTRAGPWPHWPASVRCDVRCAMTASSRRPPASPRFERWSTTLRAREPMPLAMSRCRSRWSQAGARRWTGLRRQHAFGGSPMRAPHGGSRLLERRHGRLDPGANSRRTASLVSARSRKSHDRNNEERRCRPTTADPLQSGRPSDLSVPSAHSAFRARERASGPAVQRRADIEAADSDAARRHRPRRPCGCIGTGEARDRPHAGRDRPARLMFWSRARAMAACKSS